MSNDPLALTTRLDSGKAPAEPNKFDAELRLPNGARSDVLPFQMHEPHGHD